MKSGWVKKSLGEVCTLQRGFDLPKRLREQGSYPVVSSSGCIDSHAQARVLGPGVVTGRSGSIGAVFFIESDFWPLNTTLYVKNFHGNDQRFIFHLLNSFELRRFSSGAGVPTLNRNNVHCKPVWIPPSIPEQKRIVAILDEVFAGISQAFANAEKNLANARELFESYLNRVFTEKGEGWVEKRLGDIAIFSQGKQVGVKDQQKEPKVGYVRFVRIIDYTQKTDDIRYVRDPGARYIVSADDIVMVRYGTPGLIGRGIEGVIANNLFKISIKLDSLDKNYLALFLMQKPLQDFLSTRGSATMPALNFGHLQEINVSFPPLSVQKRLVQQLNVLQGETQHLETIYQQKLASLTELKQSILQKAFTGELTADTAQQQVNV